MKVVMTTLKFIKIINRLFVFLFVFSLLFSVATSSVFAEEADSASVFGSIEEPVGVAALNSQSESGIGLLLFISNMLKLATAVAGIWVMFNFITAGFTYVTASGDKGAYEKIGTKLSLSVTGLVLIVGTYTIAGIIGLLIFGDATYIINPQIPTAIQ